MHIIIKPCSPFPPVEGNLREVLVVNCQADEIVDVINDMQQAIVSSLCTLKLSHFSLFLPLTFLQYLAFFVKDPAEKEEKLKEVLGNTVPQGLLRFG